MSNEDRDLNAERSTVGQRLEESRRALAKHIAELEAQGINPVADYIENR